MPTYTPHTLEGAALELDGNATRRTASGIIEGLDTSDPGLVLEKAYQFMQTQGHILGQTYFQGSSTLLLKRMRFDPLSGDAVRVTEIYDSETGISPAAYVITDRSYTTQYQTQRVPGTGEVIRVGASVAAESEVPLPFGLKIKVPFTPIEPDNLTINMLRPMRAIHISALIAGKPTDVLRNAVGRVNNAVWCGLPAGFWLAVNISTVLAKFAGYYSYSAEAITKIDEPWQETGILFNQKTQKYIPVNQAELTAALQEPYFYGVKRYNGFVVVGPYKGVGFQQVFGFSDTNSI